MIKVIEDYNLLEKIGSGQYGNVYKAEHRKTKQLFAVKVMKAQKFKEAPKLSEFTNNEINILTKMSHPNIIKFVEMLRTTSNYYLVYQFCNGGTLAELIKKRGRLPEGEALKIFQQLRLAFAALYQAHILHRDLKPTNILFNDGVVKLADFGFCKELLKENDMTQTMVGSPIYMAPEVLKGLVYDSRADIWSLGVILYEMLFGTCPYEESSIPKLITLIDSHYLKIPPDPPISENLKAFLFRMLTIKFRERISPVDFIKYDIGKVVIEESKPTEAFNLNFRQAAKYVRKALIYLTETIEVLTPQTDDLVFLRLAFMISKIIGFVLKITDVGGGYWENLALEIQSPSWSTVNEQEQKLLKPYNDLTREALLKEDTGLKTKVELDTSYIDSRYFLDNVRRVEENDVRMRLLNCFLYNKHFATVMEKRPPDWTDPYTDGVKLPEKEEICMKLARYY